MFNQLPIWASHKIARCSSSSLVCPGNGWWMKRPWRRPSATFSARKIVPCWKPFVLRSSKTLWLCRGLVRKFLKLMRRIKFVMTSKYRTIFLRWRSQAHRKWSQKMKTSATKRVFAVFPFVSFSPLLFFFERWLAGESWQAVLVVIARRHDQKLLAARLLLPTRGDDHLRFMIALIATLHSTV